MVRQLVKFSLSGLMALSVLAGDIEAADIESGEGGESRPFVRGGGSDKPFIAQLGRRSMIGGYSEVHFRYEREEGVTEELLFEAKRFNLFTFTPVSERTRVAAELEFEEGGEEIKVELAILDFEIHPSFTFRGGIILSPLGRFNLSHDSPANDLTDRPLVSTRIIPTTLSEAGMGFYGAFNPAPSWRITYEAYGVNGFNTDVLTGDPDGTRIPAGKGNFEDNNTRPAFVGRLAVSPTAPLEIAASVHTGPYNSWKVEGLRVDNKRDLTIFALDWDYSWRRFEVLGEYAGAWIDVPRETPIFADSQRGLYGQVNAHFGHGWIATLPNSKLTGVVRYGAVDFDTDVDGDSQQRLTLGLNLRPEEDTVFKLDYQYNWLRDGFNIEARSAAVLFSAATYF